MKLATAFIAALVLAGTAGATLACSGAYKQTTAQNQDRPLLPPQDARS